MYKKKRVLDQKLIRENPTSVEENLSLRGKFTRYLIYTN